MAEKSDTLLMDFIGGEISQYMAARTDLNSFLKSLSWCQNFIVLPQGGLKFRTGTALAGLSTDTPTAASFISFQFSASDALMIVATNNKFRFFRDDGIVLSANAAGGVAITGISQANPCVVTAPAHGMSNGQEVILVDVLGMQQLYNRFFIIANVTTNTFSLQDQFGNAIDSTAYDAYVSGGVIFFVYSILTPYLADDLFYLRYDQIGDVMYICCQNPQTSAAYPPYKLTRKGLTSWTLATFSRTNDPFTPVYAENITGVTQANPAVVTCASTAAMATGDVVYETGTVVGMTELNGQFYQITVIDGTHFSLADLQGNPIDSTGFTAWSSGGTFSDTTKWPATCAFTGDGRQSYANTGQNPNGFWASELPTGTTSNFDNFTTGSTNSDAIIFALTPVNGTIDDIQDLIQFSGNIAFLNASTIELMFGATPGTPPTPTQVGTQPTYQGAFYARGLVINWDLIFIDINQKKLRGMQFNLAFQDYQATDYNLAAQHLGEESPFIKIVFVRSNPEIIWVLRADGVLLAFTFNNIEKVQAFSRVYIGGEDAQVIDIATIRNSNGTNELWLCVQRTIQGQSVVTVEFLTQWPVFPALRDFYSGPDSQESDMAQWENAAWEVGKDGGTVGINTSDPTFLDCCLSYDGHDRSLGAPGSTKYTFYGQIIPNEGVNITPSGTTGNITITADSPIFQPSDVNCQIWKDYTPAGSGGGRAQITQVVSSTVVNATVIEAFDTADMIVAGYPGWGFAINKMYSLDLYEGLTMGVITDGGKHAPQTVTDGSIDLALFAQVVQVGFPYIGFAASQNIAPQSKTGPTAYKPRTIKQVHVQLCETSNVQIGPSEYMLQQAVLRNTTQISNRTPPPFSGVVKLGIFDSTTEQAKQIVIVQTDPTPCTVLALDVEIMLSDRP